MMTHDQLQSACFQHMWNERPELRYLYHSNMGDIKIIESVLRGTTGQSIGKSRAIILSKLKSIGMVPGRWDNELYYNGQIYFFECKIPPDHLSELQIEFQKANEKHGGLFFVYSSIDEFKSIIDGIVR